MENVQLFKNGGVGALNDMGTQEAAVHAERWCWVVVTRKPGELRTYVNGRLCAMVKLVERVCRTLLLLLKKSPPRKGCLRIAV